LGILISITFVNLLRKTEELNKHLISANKKLEELSTTDELTKLNNRRSFLEYMDIIWKQNHRLKLPITILMIDVDYFKEYNDSLGHLEGDKALFTIAQCMKNHVKRETDFVARFGGEEFVCLLPFINSNEALEFAKTLIKKVETMKIAHPASECSPYLTISAGMASFVPDDNHSQEQLLDEADKALYMAKNSGRNRVVVN
jgi:diguanylate cyclase (GGDEF)-like protein